MSRDMSKANVAIDKHMKNLGKMLTQLLKASKEKFSTLVAHLRILNLFVSCYISILIVFLIVVPYLPFGFLLWVLNIQERETKKGKWSSRQRIPK